MMDPKSLLEFSVMKTVQVSSVAKVLRKCWVSQLYPHTFLVRHIPPIASMGFKNKKKHKMIKLRKLELRRLRHARLFTMQQESARVLVASKEDTSIITAVRPQMKMTFATSLVLWTVEPTTKPEKLLLGRVV